MSAAELISNTESDRSAGRADRSTLDKLPPFPEGWYLVTTRDTLQREKLIEKKWMGEDIVVWCDDEGRVCVADSICPHLGSDLGPKVGGKVCDGRLVCPFHGFEFDATGQCVATPFAPAPKAARLKVYENRELCGMVFAWYGTGGRAAHWYLPDDPPQGAEWGELGFRTVRFRSHPQEIAENSVDIGHLRYVHGYENVRPIGSVTVEGAYMMSRFDFSRGRRVLGLFDLDYDVSAVAHIHGLGYSFVEIHEKTIDMHSRMWILATPIDGTRVELVVANQLLAVRRPRRFISGLGFLPLKLRNSLMNQIILAGEKQDIMQDVEIWEKKRYVAPPRLCKADGPIGTYRRYCRQFYPERATA